MPDDFDEIRVKRHCKFKSENAGQLDIHCSHNVVGVWLSSNLGKDSGVVGLVAEAGKLPYMCVYPDRNYFNGSVKTKLPFAFSANGLQVPHEDGSVTILSLSEISQLVRKLKA